MQILALSLFSLARGTRPSTPTRASSRAGATTSRRVGLKRRGEGWRGQSRAGRERSGAGSGEADRQSCRERLPVLFLSGAAALCGAAAVLERGGPMNAGGRGEEELFFGLSFFLFGGHMVCGPSGEGFVLASALTLCKMSSQRCAFLENHLLKCHGPGSGSALCCLCF